MRRSLVSAAFASLLCASLAPIAAQQSAATSAAAPAALPQRGTAAPAASRDAAVGLSRDEARRRAGTGAASVRAAASLVESARRQVWVAASTWLPSVSASASGAWLANPPKAGSMGELPLWFPVPSGTPLPPPLTPTYTTIGGENLYTGPFASRTVRLPNSDAKDTYFKGNVTLSQPLFAWGKIKAGVELAKLEEEIATLKLSGSRLDAERQAAKSYDAALFARDSAAILGELRDLAAAAAKDAEDALAAGTSTRAAVLQAEAQVADLDARVVEAKEGEATALRGLALTAGLGDAPVTLSSELRDTLPPLDEARIVEAALAASTDRGAARARLSEAARKLDLERGSSILLPDLAAFASLDASGQTIPFSASDWMDSTWSWDLTLGVQAQVKVFDGGASLAKAAAAGADLAAARIGAEGSEDSVRMAVRDAVATARRSQATLASKRARAAWAAEALRAAAVSLDAGVMSRPDYDATAMFEAGTRLDLLSARYALSDALAELERLAGGSLP